MTRKHYVMLAKLLNRYGINEKLGYEAFIGELVGLLKVDNPNFNIQKFKDAVNDGDM